MSGDTILIRKCHQLDEMQAWRRPAKRSSGIFPTPTQKPLRMFVVAEKVGGQVIAAFAEKEMAGFALSVPGFRGGHSYLHSHMLAVRQRYQNAGLGRRLKLFQRDDALARGFELIEWTFDPLEIKNAYLNIAKLGAIARRYSVNQYGLSSSPLQGGLPTDRLVAEWWLKSKRVETLLRAGKPAHIEKSITISVPVQIYDWKASLATRNQAKDVQDRNREQFLKSLRRGMGRSRL